jgi:hypothetical protein
MALLRISGGFKLNYQMRACLKQRDASHIEA